MTHLRRPDPPTGSPNTGTTMIRKTTIVLATLLTAGAAVAQTATPPAAGTAGQVQTQAGQAVQPGGNATGNAVRSATPQQGTTGTQAQGNNGQTVRQTAPAGTTATPNQPARPATGTTPATPNRS